MKLIIDIPEEHYQTIKSIISIKDGDTFRSLAAELFDAVKNGEILNFLLI